MKAFIYIALEKDARWYGLRDGKQCEISSSDVEREYEHSNSADEKRNGVIYARQGESCVFLCAKDMVLNGRLQRTTLIGLYSAEEFDNSGRAATKCIIPEWFNSLDSATDKKAIVDKNLSHPDTWFSSGANDAWTGFEFDRELLAQIVDELLNAIKANRCANIVLNCSSDCLDFANKLMRKVLRCVPILLSNRLSFNTAAKDSEPFDVCCGNFKEKEVHDKGGIWIDVDRLKNENYYPKRVNSLSNLFAEYITFSDGDPCEGFEEIEDIDKLNIEVEQKVLVKKCDNVIKRIKERNVSIADLSDLAQKCASIKAIDESIECQLINIACLLHVDIGVFQNYLNLSDAHKKFYRNFLFIEPKKKGKIFNWNSKNNVDATLNAGDGDTKLKYLLALYSLWRADVSSSCVLGTLKNDIASFLFKDYDSRILPNSGIEKPFQSFFDSMIDNDLSSLIVDGNLPISNFILGYIVKRFDYNARTMKSFCQNILSQNDAKVNFVGAIYYQYFVSLMNSSYILSINEWREVAGCISTFGVKLTKEEQNAMTQKVRQAEQNNYYNIVNSLDEKLPIKPSNAGIRLAKKANQENKQGTINLNDDIALYNLERLNERDYGKAGNVNDANWFKRLSVWAIILCVLQGIMLCCFVVIDSTWEGVLFIRNFGLCKFILNILSTVALAVIWIIAAIQLYRYNGECDRKTFRLTRAKLVFSIVMWAIITMLVKGLCAGILYLV